MPNDQPGSLVQIYDALVQGYNKVPVAGTKWTLTAAQKPDDISKVSDEILPYLLFDIGTMTLAPWKVWEQYATWSVDATLKIKAEPGDTDRGLLKVLYAIMLRTAQILGLPVDSDGNIVPYVQNVAGPFDGQDGITFLVDRGAPILSSVQAQQSDGKYLTASIRFTVQCVLDLDPRQYVEAQSAIFGISPSPPGLDLVTVTLPDGSTENAPSIPTSDESTYTLAQPPTPAVPVRSLQVTPTSLSLSSGSPTAPLAALATFLDYTWQYVTATATWSTSDATVATVDSSGNVTRVAAGSCTVSCTYVGATSNAVAVTCS